jgi:DNA-binding CsgD family transcriptional regulator
MTKTSLSDREKKILERLKKSGSASIQELADAFSVSAMTIHRDLNNLASFGYVEKQHGSVLLASASKLPVDNPCAMCGKTTGGHKTFIVHLANGEQRQTCCAHCGLMLHAMNKNVSYSMAADFLHNHMISANQAIYLIGADINICCIPSILTFGSRQEAERFQSGFGGKLYEMNESIRILSETIHSISKA